MSLYRKLKRKGNKMVKNVRRRGSVLSHLAVIGEIERKAKVEALKEKWGDGKITRRGGRPVVIKERVLINTSAASPIGSSEIILENYEGQWHCIHDYEVENKKGSFADSGYVTTEEALNYLKYEKELIYDRRKELNKVSRNLNEVIRRLENERT